MDQYRSRLKLSENFERHWSIQISGEIHMDQLLVHTFSWGNSYGPMVLKVLLKFPPTLVLVHGWLFPVLLRDFGTIFRICSTPHRGFAMTLSLKASHLHFSAFLPSACCEFSSLSCCKLLSDPYFRQVKERKSCHCPPQ